MRQEIGIRLAGRPNHEPNLSFALNYALGGRDPRGYHLVNLALHLMTGLLVLGIVRRTLDRLAVGNRSAASRAVCIALEVAGISFEREQIAVSYREQVRGPLESRSPCSTSELSAHLEAEGGLLVNFNVAVLRDGLKRVVL